jgi:hypothetical protein
MRTKTLLLTAAFAVATAATSMAQVYSENVVGYVNVTLNTGFNLLANPLVGGTNKNNGILQVLPSVPNGTVLSKLNANGIGFTTDLYFEGAWYDQNDQISATTLAPGEGFFLENSSGSASNITFVGEVKTGTNSVAIRGGGGLSLVGSVVPQTYELIGTNFPAVNNMNHYKLLPNGTYATSLFFDGSWYDSNDNPIQLTTAPAQGFWIFNTAPATNWTRAFNVQ